ncbi:MAG: hypothetical protein ACR2O4_10835 [Hyphomicrobiaceae bacterium]
MLGETLDGPTIIQMIMWSGLAGAFAWCAARELQLKSKTHAVVFGILGAIMGPQLLIMAMGYEADPGWMGGPVAVIGFSVLGVVMSCLAQSTKVN